MGFFSSIFGENLITEEERNALLRKYKLNRDQLTDWENLNKDRFMTVKDTHKLRFCNFLESYARLTLGFKQGHFDPIDEPTIWLSSRGISDAVVDAAYADLRDLCEHHGIKTLEEKGAIHLESIELCNSLPGNVKFNVIAECAVIDAINNGRVNGVVNIRTLTSEPELAVLRAQWGALTHLKN